MEEYAKQLYLCESHVQRQVFFQILFLKKEIDKHTNTSFLGQHNVDSNNDDTIVVVLSDTGATVQCDSVRQCLPLSVALGKSIKVVGALLRINECMQTMFL